MIDVNDTLVTNRWVSSVEKGDILGRNKVQMTKHVRNSSLVGQPEIYQRATITFLQLAFGMYIEYHIYF